MRQLPKLVTQLAYGHDAWIVGSAAKSLPSETVRDYDVIVPFAHWFEAALLIPTGAKPNTFGGWKCESEGCSIDVWPGDLGRLMTHSMATHAWHPKTGTKFAKIS